MSAPDRYPRAWLLLLWPLIGVLVLLGGCVKRDIVENADETASLRRGYSMVVYHDTVTGCEYLTSGYGSALHPRIAADGKTHMGCNGGKHE